MANKADLEEIKSVLEKYGISKTNEKSQKQNIMERVDDEKKKIFHFVLLWFVSVPFLIFPNKNLIMSLCLLVVIIFFTFPVYSRFQNFSQLKKALMKMEELGIDDIDREHK